MEENPNDPQAQDDTTPISNTAEDGGLMVTVTDTFSETGGGGGGEEETPAGNG